MTDLLETIAAYIPPCIIRATLQSHAPAPPVKATTERFPAAVLFADVSGFTPLTEALAQKGSEGPEELTRLLNQYFSRMIAIIEAEGGEVVKFSGDAMTAVFRAEDESLNIATRRAWQTATAMQRNMDAFATMETSAGTVALGMKIGIGAGDILSAQVGGGEGRWEYLIAGAPLRQVAEAEHQAIRGEIVLSPEAAALIHPESVPPRPLPQPDWTVVPNPAATEAALRAFVPRTVLSWLSEELQDWLAVLRPMTVLFVGVAGVDYQQSDAIERLHTFLQSTQEIISRYEGNINKLAVDDKGTVLLALFGAPPFAHEDDPERALRCALDLQTMAQSQSLQLAIGVTTGRVFAGPVGSASRREYTVMGDTVNLAARLMSLAGPGEIRCNYETYRWSRQRVALITLPPVGVKGKAGLIRVYKPTGENDPDQQPKESSDKLIGRQSEMAQLNAALDNIQSSRHSFCLIMEGEAGIGKSRLIEELTLSMYRRGLAGLKGMGRSIEQHTPYRAWRDIFSSFFDIDDVNDLAIRRQRVVEQVNDSVPEMVERLPLLNDVLNLGLPENNLTNSLDAHLRHESLVSFLLTLLYAWAKDRPLVLVLEDAQWLDSLSWDLILQVLRGLSVAQVPLLLVVAMRPMKEDAFQSEARAVSNLAITEHMLLSPLSTEETLALAASCLDLEGDLPESVTNLVQTRADGNPFFAAELVYTLRDNDLIVIQDVDGEKKCLVKQDLAVQTLPDTIEGIVLSRLDRLPPEKQLTLKVAAVIGRTFAYPTLHDTLGEHLEISHRLLTGYLEDLAHLDLTPLEAPEPELTYIFKHIITQEVAYETLLHAQRRQLHTAVALWYEQKFGQGAALPSTGRLETPLAPYYPLLVYHWHKAGNLDSERLYARLAGQWAAAQFANIEAARYFSRALELTPENDLAARYELLLARESVNDLLGEREAQLQDLNVLQLLALEMKKARLQAEIALRQANYFEATSEYESALDAAFQAVTFSTQSHDSAGETEAHISWGRVLWRKGDFDTAGEKLGQALTLARSQQLHTSEARSLHTLGHVHLFQGDYPTAEKYYRQALEIYRDTGERQGEGDNLSNLGVIYYDLGDYPAARDHDEQALTIYHAIGDRRGETIVLSNLGVIYADMGDYEAARNYHQEALEIRSIIGDRQGEATSLVNLGFVNHGLGENNASRKNCEQALTIQEEIGDKRGQGYSLTYLGHALTALDELNTAAQVYEKAMSMRRDLGQTSLAIDDLAGLARVALAQENKTQALAYVREILTWIEENGSDGIEYPLQVNLTCYQVLKETASGDTAVHQQADTLLAKTYAELQKQANNINNEDLRHMFLENVATHQMIIAAWESA